MLAYEIIKKLSIPKNSRSFYDYEKCKKAIREEKLSCYEYVKNMKMIADHIGV